MSELEKVEWECSMCGLDNGPSADCALCKGSERFRQRKAFTLSEVRQGIEADLSRYTRTGAVGPQIVNLPGSGGPGGSLGN